MWYRLVRKLVLVVDASHFALASSLAKRAL